MGSITRNQWFAIAILLLTVLTGGSAQLTDLIGAYATKLVISFSTLATGFLAGVQIILTGQGGQISDMKYLAQSGSPEISKQAKVALLDATANLPEVQGNIRVTDQSLVDATVSTQVTKG